MNCNKKNVSMLLCILLVIASLSPSFAEEVNIGKLLIDEKVVDQLKEDFNIDENNYLNTIEENQEISEIDEDNNENESLDDGFVDEQEGIEDNTKVDELDENITESDTEIYNEDDLYINDFEREDVASNSEIVDDYLCFGESEDESIASESIVFTDELINEEFIDGIKNDDLNIYNTPLFQATPPLIITDNLYGISNSDRDVIFKFTVDFPSNPMWGHTVKIFDNPGRTVTIDLEHSFKLGSIGWSNVENIIHIKSGTLIVKGHADKRIDFENIKTYFKVDNGATLILDGCAIHSTVNESLDCMIENNGHCILKGIGAGLGRIRSQGSIINNETGTIEIIDSEMRSTEKNDHPAYSICSKGQLKISGNCIRAFDGCGKGILLDNSNSTNPKVTIDGEITYPLINGAIDYTKRIPISYTEDGTNAVEKNDITNGYNIYYPAVIEDEMFESYNSNYITEISPITGEVCIGLNNKPIIQWLPNVLCQATYSIIVDANGYDTTVKTDGAVIGNITAAEASKSFVINTSRMNDIIIEAENLNGIKSAIFPKIIANHSFGEYIITLNPTTSTSGLKYHVCTVCNYVETEIIPATGNHSGGGTSGTSGGGGSGSGSGGGGGGPKGSGGGFGLSYPIYYDVSYTYDLKSKYQEIKYGTKILNDTNIISPTTIDPLTFNNSIDNSNITGVGYWCCINGCIWQFMAYSTMSDILRNQYVFIKKVENGHVDMDLYHFDMNGNMTLGLSTDNSLFPIKNYFFSNLPSGNLGAAVKGWYRDPFTLFWYYADPFSYDLKTGWQKIGDKEYYFETANNQSKPFASMYWSETTPDGYYVNSNGEKLY